MTAHIASTLLLPLLRTEKINVNQGLHLFLSKQATNRSPEQTLVSAHGSSEDKESMSAGSHVTYRQHSALFQPSSVKEGHDLWYAMVCY